MFASRAVSVLKTVFCHNRKVVVETMF